MPEPDDSDIVVGRAILAQSPSRPVGPGRRLVVEATFMV